MKKREYILGLLVLVGVFFLGAFNYCQADSDTIYVDASVATSGTGSALSPYKTISEGLEEAEEGDKVTVEDGTYIENIKIPAGVTVEGDDRETVFIYANDSSEPTVEMKNGSEIKQATIMNGKYGVYVKSESGAVITKCIIRDNKNYGVKIKRSTLVEDYEVTISYCTIFNNKKDGIYGQKRVIDIYDNEISYNDRNGIYLEGEVFAEVKDNDINYNDESGMDVMIDSSEIVIDDNDFKHNDGSGVEIHAIKGDGTVDVTNCKFKKNKKYAVRRVQHGWVYEALWKVLTLGSDNTFKRDIELSDIKLKK
ncbi:MAG: right-handed parallel beta-helix repeat-containing protein [Patescibacteria group bacterium]|nr:right-handed parallel beta-helix repeat-containing protein [Patescibacteria group bacterium]